MARVAIGFAILFPKGTASQRVHAERANKVFGVPLLVQGVDAPARHRLAAPSAQRPCHLVVVDLTVRLPLVLKKRTPRECLVAVEADKVVRVPLLAEGVDAVSFDGLVARGTAGSEEGEEVGLAVGDTVLLKEPAVQWL
jgi:hypothetical protein